MCCKACPFAFTDESESIQNLGCLPTPWEILKIKRDTGKNWACHEDETRICAGFVQECRERGLEYRGGELSTYSRWYYGEPETPPLSPHLLPAQNKEMTRG